VWLALDPSAHSHWFYEDFVRESNPQFPSLPLKKFSQIFFRACPVLHRWSSDFEIAFNHFMQYKTRVPVCGAIMLNDTWEKVCTPRLRPRRPALTIFNQCILVKGWKSSAGWGFPKGKINQDEEPHKCAVREVHTFNYFGCLVLLTVTSRFLRRPVTTSLARLTGTISLRCRLSNKRFPYILFPEYQKTTHSRLELAKRLV
jgi:hypothetical protein